MLPRAPQRIISRPGGEGDLVDSACRNVAVNRPNTKTWTVHPKGRSVYFAKNEKTVPDGGGTSRWIYVPPAEGPFGGMAASWRLGPGILREIRHPPEQPPAGGTYIHRGVPPPSGTVFSYGHLEIDGRG